jgi:hypothetical protein
MGSWELLTPNPHTTHHAGPQWAVQQVGTLDEKHKGEVLYCNILKAKPPTQKSPAHGVGLLRQR